MMPDTDDLKSASTVALGLMILGVQAIDRKFGEGYSENNPVLLSAFMRTAVLDMLACKVSGRIDELSIALANADSTDALVKIGAKIVEAIHLSALSNSGDLQ